MSLTNGGRVDASTFDRGNAGSVEITASDTITIDGENSEGTPSGATSLVNSEAEGDAGGVTITTGSLTLTNGGHGGNLTIDAPFIVAFPQENNDITANAFQGDGGNITINTNGIFGIEFRNQQTPLSDITASSELGQQGEVEINTSGLDPTRGLNNLPQEAVEARAQRGQYDTEPFLFNSA